MSRYMRQVGIKTRKYVSLTRSEDIKLGGKKKNNTQSLRVSVVYCGEFSGRELPSRQQGGG